MAGWPLRSLGGDKRPSFGYLLEVLPLTETAATNSKVLFTAVVRLHIPANI